MQPATLKLLIEVIIGLLGLLTLALAVVLWHRSRLAAGLLVIASLLILLAGGIGLLTGLVVDPMLEEGHDLSTALVINGLVEGAEYACSALGLFLMLLAVVVDRPRLPGRSAMQQEPLELVLRVTRQYLPSLLRLLIGRTGRRG